MQSNIEEKRVGLLVCIVNYKTANLTIDCLRSLESEVNCVCETKVIVVDNDSPDSSSDLITSAICNEGWTDWCHLIQTPTNGGFAYGNNFALLAATSGNTPWGKLIRPLVWLLNPDTRVMPGTISQILTFLENKPKIGILGTRILNEDGSIRNSAFRFPTIFSEFEISLSLGPLSRLLSKYCLAYAPATSARKVDWVSGASLIVRREVIDRIGFLDERFFMYFEETDFCRSATSAGYEIWQVPNGSVVHLVGKSSGVTGESANSRRRPHYWFHAREYYFRKNHGAAYANIATVVFLIFYPVGLLLDRIRGRQKRFPPFFWRDMLFYGYIKSPR